MSADDWGALVLVLLGFGLAAGLAGWVPAARRIWAPASLLLLLAAAILTTIPATVDLTTVLVLLAGALAAAGGGPVTALVFDLVDRREIATAAPSESMEQASHVLRGGAWIGVLERMAIFATLVAGWPEGLAIVLAVKGVGRYPELGPGPDGGSTGAAERFIIGTFTSVLWACGCAAVVLLLR